jgi:hypothetical protein
LEGHPVSIGVGCPAAGLFLFDSDGERECVPGTRECNCFRRSAICGSDVEPAKSGRR